MIRFHTPFDGKRFIGDKKRKIFHDSFHEAGPLFKWGGCQIERIALVDVATFNLDTPAEAIGQGYVPCQECM